MNTMKKSVIITANDALSRSLHPFLEGKGYLVSVAEEWPEQIQGDPDTLLIVDQQSLPSVQNQGKLSYVHMIVFLYENQYTIARHWMSLGAELILLYPEELDAFRDYLDSLETKQKSREEKVSAISTGVKVLGFYSAKGGSGKSLISSMVAQRLSTFHDQKVLLIDLNAQSGGLEAMYNLEPRRSYIDLLPVLNELSYYHLTSVIVYHEDSNLHLLLGPANPDQAQYVTEELITRTIRLARLHYDYIILDIPGGIYPYSFAGLKESDQLYYVLTPDSLSIRAYKQIMPFLERYNLTREGYLSLIVNRVNTKSEITVKDIQTILDLPIAAKINANYFVLQPFLNMGKSFYDKKKKATKVKSFHKALDGFIKMLLKGGGKNEQLHPNLPVQQSMESKGT